MGSAGTTSTILNAATAPMLSRTASTSSSASRSADAPALSTTKPRGTWPLISSATPITAHSATAGCRGQHGLDRSGRHPMSRNVDDVVGAAHHEQVAVVVDVAAVAGEVVAGKRGQVRRHVAVVVTPQRRQGARRQRQLHADRALLVRVALGTVWPQDPHVVTRHRHRRRPGLDRQRLDTHRVGGDRPARLGLPPVIDDRDAQLLRRPVIGAGVEPFAGLEQILQRRQVVASSDAVPSGSSFLIARIAVGAVNNAFTPCSDATRQNAPASGVPTGLPS